MTDSHEALTTEPDAEAATPSAVKSLVTHFIRKRPISVIALIGSSAITGFLEAGVLVIVVRIALLLNSKVHTTIVSLGPFGNVHLSMADLFVTAIVMSLIRLVLASLSSYLAPSMSASVLSMLRKDTLSSFLHATWPERATVRGGTLQELMTFQVTKASDTALTITNGISALFNFLALVISAFVIDVVSASTIVVAVVVLFLAMRPMSKLTKRYADQHGAVSIDFANLVSETVLLSEEIQTFDAFDTVDSEIGTSVDGTVRPYFLYQFMGGLVPAVYQSVAIILIVGALAAVNAIGSSAAALGSVVLILVRGLSYTQSIQGTYNQLNMLTPYADRVDEAKRTFDNNRIVDGTRHLSRITEVSFRDVSYSYHAGQPVLHGLDLSFGSGETIGVIGASGAGKSTFVQILLRLRDPESGNFIVNGHDAADYTMSSWTHNVCFVPQEPKLLTGTVADNIRFHRDLDDDAIVWAAKRAHIHDDILSWSDGYDTVVDQRASAVSGGQKQRLIIARAFAGKPSLLVLDEPTSALDMHSEMVVQQAIEELRGSATVVIIAHRLTTLQSCDRVMVLNHGVLDAFATSSELLSSNSFYREAVELSGLS